MPAVIEMIFSPEKDAEGWETVQRGRPARPRSAAVVAKVSPVLAHSVPRDDSDKENSGGRDPEQTEPVKPVDTPVQEERGGDEKAEGAQVLGTQVTHPLSAAKAVMVPHAVDARC